MLARRLLLVLMLQVEAEGSIPSDLRFYCPNPHCSAPIQLDKSKAQPNDPLNCAACSTKICIFCRVEWHKGFTCEEYQVSHDGRSMNQELEQTTGHVIFLQGIAFPIGNGAESYGAWVLGQSLLFALESMTLSRPP